MSSLIRKVAAGTVPALVLVAAAVTPSVAQQPVPDAELATAAFPAAVALGVPEAPTLDGDVLGDPSWADAVPATGFVQNTPDEGRPASERTEVRILYTTDTLYFGVVCYDQDPSAIIVSDSRRDSSLEETDSFQIILDTFRDQQNGFVFGTNPSGLEYDGQVVNEGQGSGRFSGGLQRPGGGQGRQQRGSGGGFNLNWDGAWEVRTRTSEVGWSAEFAIPFRTLRFPSGGVQTWAVNFQRNIRRRNESAFWAPLPRQFTLYRLSLAGALTGLAVPVQRNLKITPYVLGEALRVDTQATRDTSLTGDIGVDLKYSVTPSLTLDLTYNTDFAQVEVDEEQVNLDRFNLFFPEKRPFFLENAGLFSVGVPGQTEIFFSRRIGIGPSGEVVPILGGGRLSGNVSGLNVGLLNMQTDAVSGLTPANNFTVVRVRHDLRNRSNIGAMFTNRQATGDLAGDRDHNRSYAVDGRFGVGQNGLLSGFAARTESPDLQTSNDHAVNMASEYNSEAWRLSLGYGEVGDNFNPEVGFLTRTGFRQLNGRTMYVRRPERALGLLEMRPHVTYISFWDFDGFQETGYLHFDNHLEWKSGHELSTGINFTREGVVQPFEIFPGVIVPPGAYDHREAVINVTTNQGAPLHFNMRTFAGGFFGGSRLAMTPSVQMRVGETFNAEIAWSRNDIDLPGGAFVANVARTRVSYSFTPRIFVQSLVQYNDRADLWSTNLRLGWLQLANTGLFIVYNDTRGLAGVTLAGAGRSLTVKFSQLFDVLH